MTGGDDVVDADEGGAESVGDDGGVVAADVRAFFDCFGFHVAISDCCSRWGGWANIVLPLCVKQKAARDGGHNCARVYDGVRVVG